MEPYDEPEIEAAETLIRRIDRTQHVVRDENFNCERISTKAFSPSSEPNGGMSVDIKRLIEQAGLDAREYVTTPKYIGSVAFSAGAARDENLLVGYDPSPDNPYHGEVWGENRPNRFTRAQKNALLAASVWFVEIPGVEITV